MKKTLYISAVLVFVMPLVSSAAVGALCPNGDSDCNTATEFCDNTQTPAVCEPGGVSNPVNTQSTNSGFVPLAPIPGLTEGIVADSQGLADFFNNLYIFLIGLAAALAVIEIIIGGVQYATTDNISKKSDGRARIQQAILGLVLVLLPVLVFTVINPKILNLSVTWKAVTPSANQVPFGGTTPGSGGTPAPPTNTTTTSTGVTQSVTGTTYLKTATFSSANPTNNNQAATNWLPTCTGTANRRITQTSVCTGGYSQSGVCSSASPAIAMCSLASPTPYEYLDVGKNWIGLGSVSINIDYALKSLTSGGDQYAAACAADNGMVCVPKGYSMTAVAPCPTFPSGVSIPVGAPNAAGGGSCYRTSVICSGRDSVSQSYVCRSNVQFVP